MEQHNLDKTEKTVELTGLEFQAAKGGRRVPWDPSREKGPSSGAGHALVVGEALRSQEGVNQRLTVQRRQATE